MYLETQQFSFGAPCRTCINELRLAQKLHHDVFVNRLNRMLFHWHRTRFMMKSNLYFTMFLATARDQNEYPVRWVIGASHLFSIEQNFQKPKGYRWMFATLTMVVDLRQ